ncbi:MAG: hypothetical protein QOJ72_1598 [Nocardioidaceae bacterium]|jgi:hypothetical protein|nr:hypothetical protein [Nocardioidaceae bacterium]
MDESREIDPATYRAELLSAFKITETDVSSNELGRLGPSQTARMFRQVWTTQALAWAIVGGFAILLWFTAERPIQWWRYAMVTTLALALIGYGVVVARRLRESAADGQVVGLEGVVEVHVRGREGYWLTIEGRSFRLPIHFWHVASGRSYHVYVAEKAALIVAIVPMEDG